MNIIVEKPAISEINKTKINIPVFTTTTQVDVNGNEFQVKKTIGVFSVERLGKEIAEKQAILTEIKRVLEITE